MNHNLYVIHWKDINMENYYHFFDNPYLKNIIFFSDLYLNIKKYCIEKKNPEIL